MAIHGVRTNLQVASTAHSTPSRAGSRVKKPHNAKYASTLLASQPERRVDGKGNTNKTTRLHNIDTRRYITKNKVHRTEVWSKRLQT